MIYTPLDDPVKYRFPVIPSVEPEEILVNISLEVLPVAVGMHPPEPVLEVPDLYMQHGKVLPFVRQHLCQAFVVLFDWSIARPSVSLDGGIPADMVIEDRLQ